MSIIDIVKRLPDSYKAEKAYQKEDILAFEGETCRGVYLIMSGAIEIVSYALNGKEIVYTRKEQGEMFGNHLIFSSHPTYRGNVVCKEDTSLIYIGKEHLVQAMQEHQDFLMAVLQIQSDFSIELNSKMKLLSFDHAEDRFMYYLSSHDGEIAFKSISRLSNELFLKRETCSRLIHRLETEGKIKLYKNKITLNP